MNPPWFDLHAKKRRPGRQNPATGGWNADPDGDAAGTSSRTAALQHAGYNSRLPLS